AGKVTSLVLKDSDIEFGFRDSAGNYTACPTYTGFPNTIKVVLRLDSNANGPLPLFFASILGVTSKDLSVFASATIYAGTINTFSINANAVSRILPMTYDVNHWTNFLKTGIGPDGGSANTDLQVYPSNKYTGNFGLLSLDQTNDGSSTISNWIDKGMSSTDLQAEVNNHLIPLSSHPTNTWDWQGNTGLQTSNIHMLSTHIGDTYLLPLFQPYNSGASKSNDYAAGYGNGNYYYYDIVAFAAVRVTTADDHTVKVEPAGWVDPNAIFNTVGPASPPTTSSTLST